MSIAAGSLVAAPKVGLLPIPDMSEASQQFIHQLPRPNNCNCARSLGMSVTMHAKHNLT